ncbi:MAG: VCBS repeat-containing protein [Phycisphaerae bacterium]|nr:VCBS repeat-containing protein [Phycisphaerae bacterium]
MELDFDQILSDIKHISLIDPHSLRAIRIQGKRRHRYFVQFSESLYTRNQGWVAWRVEHPEKGGTWSLEFAVRKKDGRLAPAPYLPMVGVGDEIAWNGRRFRTIGPPGMHSYPIAVDFDGDGLVDILSTSHYSNAQQMPWAGIFFWRNIGTNVRPRFAPPLRLSADGVEHIDCSKHRNWSQGRHRPRYDYISDYYIRCDTFDWFRTGRPDLITNACNSGIRVYRNTGHLDETGMPRLELALKLNFPYKLPPSMNRGIRVVDWDGSGRPSILIGAAYQEPDGTDYGQIWLMRNIGGTPTRPKFDTVPLRANSTTAAKFDRRDWRTINFFPGGKADTMDWFDIDGDGRCELLLPFSNAQPEAAIEVWRNVCTPEEPIMTPAGLLPWSRQHSGFGCRFVKNAAFDGCLIGTANSGYGIHYYKRCKNAPPASESFRDKGPLLGEACKVRVEGYVRPIPFEIDGRMNLLCGDEPGYITLIRNIGKGRKDAFADPVKLTDRKGNALRFNRQAILHDDNLERDCGQLKPFLCDWDGDGKLDIILGNTTNRIFWLEQFDPDTCSVKEVHELRVPNLKDPFGWRKGPAVVDWDGDGKPELLTVNSGQEFCLFKQGGGKKGLTNLRVWKILKYTDGEAIRTNDIPPQIYNNPICSIWITDWTGTGSFDLLAGTNYQTSLLENIGTNVKPAFQRPRPLKTPDGVIEIGHHDTHAAVRDWNHDGRDDVMIGGESGTIYLFHSDWLQGMKHQVHVIGPRRSGDKK